MYYTLHCSKVAQYTRCWGNESSRAWINLLIVCLLIVVLAVVLKVLLDSASTASGKSVFIWVVLPEPHHSKTGLKIFVVVILKRRFDWHQPNKPNQARSGKAKPSQAKPSQVRSSQPKSGRKTTRRFFGLIKPNKKKALLMLLDWCRPTFLFDDSGNGVKNMSLCVTWLSFVFSKVAQNRKCWGNESNEGWIIFPLCVHSW